MKRLAALLVLVLLAGFYVAWPAYTAAEIRNALEAGDAGRLSQYIDVKRLKASLKPAAEAEAARTIDDQLAKSGGSAGILAAEIAKKALPRLVDVSLNALVTPENIVRIYAERGDLDGALRRALSDQIGRAGGLAGLGALKAREEPKPEAPPAPAAGPSPVRTVRTTSDPPPVAPRSPVKTLGAPDPAAGAVADVETPKVPGWRNIRRLGPAGFLTLEAAVARDPAAAEPDVTAELSFTGTGWKLTGLRKGG